MERLHGFLLLDLMTTLTYVLMDNFFPCFSINPIKIIEYKRFWKWKNLLGIVCIVSHTKSTNLKGMDIWYLLGTSTFLISPILFQLVPIAWSLCTWKKNLWKNIIIWIHLRPVCCQKFEKSFKLQWLLFNSNHNDLKSIFRIYK